MRFSFLASFILFLIWLSFTLSRLRRREEKQQTQFWQRERQANSTRRKSLDGLCYIKLPLSDLPMETATADPAVSECLDTIQTLSDQPIVNLTGYSNTDLKLMYGAPNITLLTEYDQRYTLLARTLQKWGTLLYELGYVQEAKSVLEFAISTATDVSGTYKLLASIYQENGEADKLAGLRQSADSLRSLSKKTIVRILQEFCPSSD